MPETNAKPIIGRIRINVSTSVKGVKTFDCTIETASPQPPATVFPASSVQLVQPTPKPYDGNQSNTKI